MEKQVRILVICTGNSCRSQMAEGYFRHFCGHRAEVRSAGIEAHGLNPLAVKFMLEDGIDISGQTSNLIEEVAGFSPTHIITVCDHAKESCPVFPASAASIHRNFQDPSKVTGTPAEVNAAFRQTRDEIRAFCREFAENLGLTLP